MKRPSDDYEYELGAVSPGGHQVGSRRRRVWRWIKIALIVLGVVIIAVLVFLFYNLSKLSINPLDFGSLQQTDGRTNVLVLGIGDPGHAGQNLSDTIMVISVDHRSGDVAMISVPRDLRVSIPGHGYAKINQANSDGGPTLAEQTVANTLGIPIHYYFKTDFSGLKDLVDAVGGIQVTVTQELSDPEYPCASDENRACGIDIKPGTYHMDGAQALEYTRCRKGTCGNDFGRAARQQEVITKLRDKLATPGVYLNPATDASVLTALRAHSQTDMSVNNLIQLGWQMKHAPKTIRFVYSNQPGGLLTGVPGSSDLVPVGGDYSALQNKAENIFAGVSESQ